ncbi:MAG: hypothetical protein V1824_04335 [archaeon]
MENKKSFIIYLIAAFVIGGMFGFFLSGGLVSKGKATSTFYQINSSTTPVVVSTDEVVPKIVDQKFIGFLIKDGSELNSTQKTTISNINSYISSRYSEGIAVSIDERKIVDECISIKVSSTGESEYIDKCNRIELLLKADK